MKQQGFILSLVAIICLSGLATTQGDDEESKTTIVNPQPQPYYMEAGNEMVLECRYNDVDASSITLAWFKDGEQIFDGSDGFYYTDEISGDVYVSVLHKKDVGLEDSASYKCLKRDSDPSKGYNMIVYIFTIVPVDAVAEPKEDLELQCLIKGELFEESSISWSVDGKSIDTGNEEKYKTNDVNNTLVIYNIAREDIKNYTCGFTLENGQNFTAIVKVESQPHVTEFTKSKNLVQGDPLTLTCEAWGVPMPSVTWFKGDEEMDDSDKRVTFEDNADGIVNATLRIKDLDFDDRAEYTCMAENMHGTANTTVLVRVKDKLAALWPFLGICAEVAILCIIIFIYERRRAKKMEEEEQQEEAGHLTNSNDHKGKEDDIRHRK